VEPARLAHLHPCRLGRRGSGGPGWVTVLQPWYLPQPQHGGGGRQVAGQVSVCRRGEPPPTKVSSGLKTKVSSGLKNIYIDIIFRNNRTLMDA
jgi:hypothetical protein